MKEELCTTDEPLTRRHFIKCGAGAVLATHCLASFGLGKLQATTAGDADHWETKMLVSEPNSSTGILELLRERIASNKVVWGMSNRISHIRSGPKLSPITARGSQMTWSFIDDQGLTWNGAASVRPSPDEREKFLVTLKLARTTK